MTASFVLLSLITLIAPIALISLFLVLILYQQNQKLKKHQKDLEAEISDKREIISVAAHEIGAPLTNIKGTLSIIAKDPGLTGPSQKFIERALISVEELITLIDSLLTASRFERGKIKLSKNLTSVEDICFEVVNQLKTVADKEGLGLAYQKPKESLPLVSLDPVRFKEVLVNFVGNAIKYASEGSVLIATSISPVVNGQRSKVKGQSSVVVSVSDNGPGINEADLKRLFNRFVRLPAPAGGREVRSGVGLGLYISRLIVEAHGGKIWAESKLGQGTTFYFSIPVSA